MSAMLTVYGFKFAEVFVNFRYVIATLLSRRNIAIKRSDALPFTRKRKLLKAF